MKRQYQNFNAQIGKRIKYFRKVNKLTQSEVGNVIGVDKSAMCHIEQGKQNIFAKDIIVLALLFKIEVHDLINVDTNSNLKEIQKTFEKSQIKKRVLMNKMAALRAELKKF